jgi:hypothetical protein
MTKDNKVSPKPLKASLIKYGFFGWNNFKWLIIELRDIYSNKDSYFSKKRIESGIAFTLMQWGMVSYFVYKCESMDIYDLLIWASIQGIICGYTINKIQKEKNDVVQPTDESGPDIPPTE